MPVQVGVDLVQVSRISESIARFGDAFVHRLFTDGEIAYCAADAASASSRFAARFAAKEATMKALRLPDGGVDWRCIEVRRSPEGWCDLMLWGAVRDHAYAARAESLTVSLSHEGDYAIAVVIAVVQDQTRKPEEQVHAG